MLLVLTLTWTVLRATSASSTSTRPCHSLNEPVVRNTLESPMAKSMLPRAAPMWSCSAAEARPIDRHGTSVVALPSRKTRRRVSDTGFLEGREEALPGGALVLVDRALVIGRRQGQANRRRDDAWLVGRLAHHHLAVELVEVADAQQWEGVGRGVFVQQEAALAIRSVERRAVHQLRVMDGHRAGRSHQRHRLGEIEVAGGRV